MKIHYGFVIERKAHIWPNSLSECTKESHVSHKVKHGKVFGRITSDITVAKGFYGILCRKRSMESINGYLHP